MLKDQAGLSQTAAGAPDVNPHKFPHMADDGLSGGCDGSMGAVRHNSVTLVSGDRFQADPGAKIAKARRAEESAAAAYDKVLNIQGDRSKVPFKFRVWRAARSMIGSVVGSTDRWF